MAVGFGAEELGDSDAEAAASQAGIGGGGLLHANVVESRLRVSVRAALAARRSPGAAKADTG